MSLLLRNACQPVLDNAGLQDFHCGVSDTGNYLTILGECGQLFVSISGVQFARTAPSKEEIPLAVDLLDAFLIKHKPDFDMYIAELAKFNALPVVEGDTDAFSVGTEGYRNTQKYYCEIETYPFMIKITEAGDVRLVNLISRKNSYTIQDIDVKVDVKKVKAGYAHMQAYKKYQENKKTINELKSKLSSCEI